MNYLPFEDFEIHTALSSDEVFYRLRAAVETKRPWWRPLLFVSKSYYGEVWRNAFRMVRITHWNRNFTPEVFGTVEQENSGSKVRVTMRLHSFSFIFWVFWLGGVVYIILNGVTSLIIQMTQSGVWLIDPYWGIFPLLGFFAFGYLMVMVSFKLETDRVKEFLVKLAGAKKENIQYKDRILGLTEFQIIRWLFLLTFIAMLGWIVYSLLGFPQT